MVDGSSVRTIWGAQSALTALAISSDGEFALAGGRNGGLWLWDLKTGIERFHTRQHDTQIWSVSISPDGSRIASGSGDGKVLVHDVESGKVLRELGTGSELVHSVSFSPDGELLATDGRDTQIQLWNLKSGNRVSVFSGHDEPVRSVVFSPDGDLIASGSEDATVRLWDVKSGKSLRTFRGHASSATSVAFSTDGGRVVAAGYDGTIWAWDVATGASVFTLNGQAVPIQSMELSVDGNRVVVAAENNAVNVWDIEKSEIVVSMFAGAGDSWLTMTPHGFFSEGGDATRDFRVSREFDIFSVDQFYDTLSRPDLVQEALAGDPLGLLVAAAETLNLDALIDRGNAPDIKLLSPSQLYRAGTNALTARIALADKGGGVGRVQWIVNGTTIALDERDVGSLETPVAGVMRTVELTRELPLEPGENVLQVVAYNAANQIASESETVSVFWEGATADGRPDLHILAAGVNDYLDHSLQLNYAVPDARSIAAAFEQSGSELFGDVHVTTLFDEAVTQEGLERTFERLSSDVKPADIFVFFLAGHGKTVDGRYYFLPQDFRYRNQDSITSDGIGQDRWQQWFARIQARKSVLMYDTCESGSLTGSRIVERGLGRLAAMDRLTRAMGRTVLSAATDNAPALEGFRGHGVFTYALLEAMGLGDASGNGRIEVTELASHIDARVPAISESAFGYIQFPQMRIVGSNFPIGSTFSALDLSDSLAGAVPAEPTHVITSRATIRTQSSDDGVAVGETLAGHQVRMIESEGEWALIARDGRELGYVPLSVVLRLN